MACAVPRLSSGTLVALVNRGAGDLAPLTMVIAEYDPLVSPAEAPALQPAVRPPQPAT